MATLPDIAQLQAQIKALEAQNAALAAKASGNITFKVSGKGAVSVYGLGQFPTTLYANGWRKLLASKDAILAFIDANAKLMAVKGEEPGPELKAHMAAIAKIAAANAAKA